MTLMDKLRCSAKETTDIANRVMRDPLSSTSEFKEAFQARDIAHVQAQGYSDEQLAEIRWETGCGCNGTDSPFHTFFGFDSDSDRYEPEEDYNEARHDWELEHMDEYSPAEMRVILGD